MIMIYFSSTVRIMKKMKLLITKCCLLLLIAEGTISFRLPSSSSYYSPRRYHLGDSNSLRRLSTASKPHVRRLVTPPPPQPLLLLNVVPTNYSPDIPYEILPLQKVTEKLLSTQTNTNVEHHLNTGLSDEDAAALLEHVGPNALEPPPKTSIWELWLQQFDGEFVCFSAFFISMIIVTMMITLLLLIMCPLSLIVFFNSSISHIMNIIII